MIDKNKAVSLRQQGLSYVEIAQELNCSVVWCKKNLSDVVKNIKEKDVVVALVKKAKSKQGLTTGEILKELENDTESVLESDLNENLSKRQIKEQDTNTMRRIKTKVKSEEGAVIRPYWMKPTEAKKSLNLVLQAVNLIDERIYEEVQYIMQQLELDESYIKSLTRAITQMSYGGSMLVPNNIRELSDSLSKAANELEKRNIK